MTDGSGGIPLNVQRTVIALLTSDTADLRELARIAGRDPATFYRGAHLRKCDLSTVILDGIDLAGTDQSLAKMPRVRGMEPGRARGSTSPGQIADIDAIIEEFKSFVSTEDAERLELAYIFDLIAKNKRESLDLAASRFLKLISGVSSPSSTSRKSIWAKLALAYVTPAIILERSYGPNRRLLRPRILERVGISDQVAEVIGRLDRGEVLLSLQNDRDQIVKTLSYASSVSSDYEIILEIAELLAMHGHYERAPWAKALLYAKSHKAASAVFRRMLELRIVLSIDSVNAWLASKPPFEDGWHIVRLVSAEHLHLSLITWNLLLNLAPDYPSGRDVFEKMVSARIGPNIVSWTALLRLAPDYKTGCSLLEEMINANVRPNKDTAMKLATLVRETNDASMLFDILAKFKLFDNLVLSAITRRLAPAMEADLLLGWVYNNCKAHGFVPRPFVFEPAIVSYRKAGRLDQALRIVMPFPHLPASIRLLRRKDTQARAEAYFQREYVSGSEPFHAAAALAHLHWIKGEREKLQHWVEVGQSYPNQHPKRIEGLSKLLSELPPAANP